jgi:hypothetical protein
MTSWAEREENLGVLRYFGQASVTGEVTLHRPPPDVDTWRLGTHPDVVDRLWDDLNGALPEDSRFLITGGPALVEPMSGIVLAVGLGTAYGLRLTAQDYDAARADGFAVVNTYRTVNVTLDLAATFGPRWVFGRVDARELEWIAKSFTDARQILSR